MNTILGYYKNDGSQTDLANCHYIQIQLLGSHAKSEDSSMLISKQSLPLILEFSWYLGPNGYPLTYCSNDKTLVFGKRGCTVHKLLIGKVNKGNVIDHMNRNKLDNRLENLRICTAKENSYNTSKPKSSINNYKGVSQQTNGLWTAKISKDGVMHEINDIQTEKDAAKIYDAMAEELFGEFAGKNFM